MEIAFQQILYFMIYSIGGWICECIYCSIPAKHFINRGFLSGPYCPIYGWGALLITWLLTPFISQPIMVFLCGLLMTSVLEYLTSWVMEALFHTKWWDYSKRFCNINGRVCLRNSLLFGLMSLAVIYGIHPLTSTLISSLSPWISKFIAIVFLLVFLCDFYHTTAALLHRNRTFLEVEKAMTELKERFEQIGNIPGETLRERIQNTLNSSDADERLHSILKDTMSKLELPKKYAHARNRLSAAFPNQHLSASRATLEGLLETLQEYKKYGDYR